MSGLAEILLERGFKISGSDMRESELTDKLASEGATIAIGQKAGNIVPGIDAVVYTAAVHPDNPEFAAAKAAGLPMLTRAELLGQIMSNYGTAVAVSGTHGKTTTTSMITEILLAAEDDPTISVGGMLDSIGGNVRVGRSDNFVTEACEYTNSFLSLHPTIGIILNICADHLDFFRDLADIRHSFRRFAQLIPETGSLILCSSIEKAEEITEGLKCRVVKVGGREQDNYRFAGVKYNEIGCPAFEVYGNGESLGRFELAVPGAHNVWNAIAAIAAAREMDVDVQTIRGALKRFAGTHRRFEKKGTLPGDVLVIDDYAHHPDEIRATLNAARKGKRDRIVVIFQPHTYTRTKALMDEFASALSLADEIILAKIYPARETDDLGISSADLAAKLASKGKKVHYFETFPEIEDYVKNNFVHGEMLITMGAGDIVKVGEDLLSK